MRRVDHGLYAILGGIERLGQGARHIGQTQAQKAVDGTSLLPGWAFLDAAVSQAPHDILAGMQQYHENVPAGALKSREMDLHVLGDLVHDITAGPTGIHRFFHFHSYDIETFGKEQARQPTELVHYDDYGPLADVGCEHCHSGGTESHEKRRELHE
ncbi:MAG: hypothetical protein WCO52_00650 [bacterium]